MSPVGPGQFSGLTGNIVVTSPGLMGDAILVARLTQVFRRMLFPPVFKFNGR